MVANAGHEMSRYQEKGKVPETARRNYQREAACQKGSTKIIEKCKDNAA